MKKILFLLLIPYSLFSQIGYNPISQKTWFKDTIQVTKAIRINNGTQGSGKVLTSDAEGRGTWQTPSGGGGSGVNPYFQNGLTNLNDSTGVLGGELNQTETAITMNGSDQTFLLFDTIENIALLGIGDAFSDGVPTLVSQNKHTFIQAEDGTGTNTFEVQTTEVTGFPGFDLGRVNGANTTNTHFAIFSDTTTWVTRINHSIQDVSTVKDLVHFELEYDSLNNTGSVHSHVYQDFGAQIKMNGWSTKQDENFLYWGSLDHDNSDSGRAFILDETGFSAKRIGNTLLHLDTVGNLTLPEYAHGRNDSASVPPINFLYIDTATGDVLVSPTLATGYTIQMAAATTSPADATTYYFGGYPAAILTTTAAIRRIYIPKDGTITTVTGFFRCTPGSSTETSTIQIRLNNTSNTNLSTTIDLSSGNFGFTTTGLSIPVVAGDYIEARFPTATWATNPVSLNSSLVIYIKQ